MSGIGSLGAPMSKKEEAAPASRLSMTLSGQGTQPPFSVCLHLTSLLSHGSQQVPPPSVCLTLLRYPINMSSNHSCFSASQKGKGSCPSHQVGEEALGLVAQSLLHLTWSLQAVLFL